MSASETSNDRVQSLKAVVLTRDIPESSAIQEDTSEQLSSIFGRHGMLSVPYSPSSLMKRWENSSSLNQNVQAYVTNVDGMGFRLVPRIDFASPDGFEKVRDEMWMRKVKDEEDDVDPDELKPDDDEVNSWISKLQSKARLERVRLESFFEFVNPDGSFVDLRKKTRQDLEITGNGYWEVLRNSKGEISRFVHVPPKFVRCTALDEESVMVDERFRIGFSWATIKQPRFFRRYAQSVGSKVVWFKQFGDPRIVSRKTGKVYEDIAEFTKESRDPNDSPASEMIHFIVHDIGEAYGVPRWIGTLLAVEGSRAADEVNYNYFDNKAIPPLIILVTGGRFDDDSVKNIERFMESHIKGQQNFHKVMILQAESAIDPTMPYEHPKIAFEKMTDVQQGDALFQNYDERNVDKIGSSFRLPRLLRGDVRDFNRATALASLRYADEQVFQPEREAFDSWMNRVILPQLDAALWSFKSLGPQTRDPERVAEIVSMLSEAGIITPNESREIVSDVIGRVLEVVESSWGKLPLKLILAGFEPDGSLHVDQDLEVDDAREKILSLVRESSRRRVVLESSDPISNDGFSDGERP